MQKNKKALFVVLAVAVTAALAAVAITQSQGNKDALAAGMREIWSAGGAQFNACRLSNNPKHGYRAQVVKVADGIDQFSFTWFDPNYNPRRPDSENTREFDGVDYVWNYDGAYAENPFGKTLLVKPKKSYPRDGNPWLVFGVNYKIPAYPNPNPNDEFAYQQKTPEKVIRFLSLPPC